MSAPSADESIRALYPSGHQESVLRSHKWRTAENSAAYALPALQEAFAKAGPGATMLDVGCGPGTITAGFAALAAPTGGKVIGTDFAASVLDEARKHAEQQGVAANASFEAGDVFKLRFADGSLVAAHTHQVLIHLADPVAALKEIRRVLKPTGSVLAVREGDLGTMVIHPSSPGLELYLDIWNKVSRAAGGEPTAGRRLKTWALAAGFKAEHMTYTSTNFCYSTPAERQWWGELWAERMAGANSSFAKSALEGGHATKEQLELMAEAWRTWSKAEDGTFIVAHGELLVQQ